MKHFAEDPLSGDCESLSLLPQEAGKKGYNSTTDEGGEFKFSDETPSEGVHGVTDTMMYRTSCLTSWEAFTITKSVVWRSPELWSMMLRLVGVALGTCVV